MSATSELVNLLRQKIKQDHQQIEQILRIELENTAKNLRSHWEKELNSILENTERKAKHVKKLLWSIPIIMAASLILTTALSALIIWPLKGQIEELSAEKSRIEAQLIDLKKQDVTIIRQGEKTYLLTPHKMGAPFKTKDGKYAIEIKRK